VPPYETEYGAEALFQQPYEISDLMGFYCAFGLRFNAEERERPDHVSCECEFLSFLALKEAYALSHEENSMLEQTRKANRLFLRDHLGRFAPAFAQRLTREDQEGFYGALGNLCTRFIAGECARLGVPVGSQNLDLRPASDDRVPMACGETGECPIGSRTSADEEP
jgi:TorA maturation chaperone TorD